jgi:colanic acid/amylovoran biosynthesis glycosyltransferase
MKVAMVVPRFPQVAETFVAGRFAALLERGFDVRVFCASSDRSDWRWFPDLEKGGLAERVHTRPIAPSHLFIAMSLPFTVIRTLLSAPGRTLRYLAAGRRAYGRGVLGHFIEDASLIRFGPDVIHFEFANLAINREATADMLGAALVASFQGYDVNYVGLDQPGYYDTLFSRLDAAHFVSADLLERATKRGLAADGRSFVVHNGIDLTAFDAPDRRHVGVCGTTDRPLRILSVGRLHWKKGYSYALQAVRLLVDRGIACDYRIVGEGDFREAILFEIEDLGLRDHVTLVGSLRADGVRQAMAWAHVFVHAAVSEGFCVSVTEAQAMRLPVVVTDADGLHENVADTESGFVVPRRDAAALADKIAVLAQDPELRNRIGEAASERVRRMFSLDAHVDGIAEVFRAAVTTL